MDIILREDFPSLGYVGDRVKVRRGFARNYLIPRGIGIEALSSNARQLKHIVDGINAKKARLKGQAEEAGRKLQDAKLEFTLKIGERGKSFGSISAKDIETALKSQGHEIDKKQIRIVEPIKKAGEFKIFIKLHAEVQIPLIAKVAVEGLPAKREKAPKEAKEAAAASEGAEAATGASTEEKPKRKSRAKKAAPAETAEGEAKKEA